MAMAVLVAQPARHLVDMTLQVLNVEVWEHGREPALTLVLAKLGQGHVPRPIANSGPGAVEPHTRGLGPCPTNAWAAHKRTRGWQWRCVTSSAETELHSFRLVASAWTLPDWLPQPGMDVPNWLPQNGTRLLSWLPQQSSYFLKIDNMLIHKGLRHPCLEPKCHDRAYAFNTCKCICKTTQATEHTYLQDE